MSLGQLAAQVYWLAFAIAVAGIVHMAVVKKDLFARLKVPLDGGREWRGKPLFGPNKTWRGLLWMAVATPALAFVQGAAFGAWAHGAGVACVDFGAIGRGAGAPDGALALGAGYALVNLAMGVGYGLGELPNSFLKRRIDIVPGKTGAGALGAFFFFLDQADSVIAGLCLAALCFPLGVRTTVAGIAGLTLLHLVLNVVMYLTRLRKNV